MAWTEEARRKAVESRRRKAGAGGDGPPDHAPAEAGDLPPEEATLPGAAKPKPKSAGKGKGVFSLPTGGECRAFMDTVYVLAARAVPGTPYRPTEAEVEEDAVALQRSIALIPVLSVVVRLVSPITLLVSVYTRILRMVQMRAVARAAGKQDAA